MPKPRRHEPHNSDLLEWCEGEFRRYLHIVDPGFIYVTLGTVVANCFKGRPVWLMLVGPSGCGKTESIMAVTASRPDWFKVLSDASRAAFLSGTSKKDKSADATGGILKEIVEKDIRFLAFKEYGSILDQRKDDYNIISSMLREIWDGYINRPVGSDGGQTIEWAGKIGNLACCTNRIDDILAEEVAKGVRWLIWRFPSSSGWHESGMAMEGGDPAEMREGLSNAVSVVLDSANLTWGMGKRELKAYENLRIRRLAALSARMQGAVKRDKYRVSEVVDAPYETYPTRIAPALVNIYLGMELIGVEEGKRWEQIRKIAFDTAPSLRVSTLKQFSLCIQGGMEPSNFTSMSEALRVGKVQVTREMEDLALLGVLSRHTHETGWSYQLTEETMLTMEDL